MGNMPATKGIVFEATYTTHLLCGACLSVMHGGKTACPTCGVDNDWDQVEEMTVQQLIDRKNSVTNRR